MGTRIRPPEAVRLALTELFGEQVAHVVVIEGSFFARLHGHVLATTRRRRIYLTGSAAYFFNDPALMLHEYFHVVNQWEPGLLTTPRYLVEWLRRGYWNNRFEVEARQFAELNLHRFRLLL